MGLSGPAPWHLTDTALTHCCLSHTSRYFLLGADRQVCPARPFQPYLADCLNATCHDKLLLGRQTTAARAAAFTVTHHNVSQDTCYGPSQPRMLPHPTWSSNSRTEDIVLTPSAVLEYAGIQLKTQQLC